jgi:maleylacetoacetate isomerase
MMKLYSYWRSSAAYRVRIALNLKNIPHETVPRHLVSGEHRQPDYLRTNPQGLVPALEHRGELFAQSLAIIEYLDSVAPAPRLLPQEPVARAHVAAMAQAIACDIHPLNNLRVMNYLRREFGHGDEEIRSWYGHWIDEGFRALEAWAAQYSSARRFMFRDEISLADVCLVPQVYNARRFGVSLQPYPLLVAIDAHLQSLPAVIDASPERQADAD